MGGGSAARFMHKCPDLQLVQGLGCLVRQEGVWGATTWDLLFISNRLEWSFGGVCHYGIRRIRFKIGSKIFSVHILL